tara:strand:- start:334 stop:459 length:126 start_codon:yes stop_codon:yes gene_type:complete
VLEGSYSKKAVRDEEDLQTIPDCKRVAVKVVKMKGESALLK